MDTWCSSPASDALPIIKLDPLTLEPKKASELLLSSGLNFGFGLIGVDDFWGKRLRSWGAGVLRKAYD